MKKENLTKIEMEVIEGISIIHLDLNYKENGYYIEAASGKPLAIGKDE